METIPFVGGDGIDVGPGATQGAILNIAGAAAANTYSTVGAIHDMPRAPRSPRTTRPSSIATPGAYSAAAYACTQVFVRR